jgi:hypothetical protein
MTNQEALSASVNYPVDKVKIQKILIDNGLNDSDNYAGTSKQFELATAAVYVLLVTSANISEGDFSISATDKSNYIKLAEGVYSKYGVDSPLSKKSTIKNRSNYW